MKEELKNISIKIKPNTKRRSNNWNPLTQPLTEKEFASLGFHSHNLQLISQKLTDIREKIPSKLIKEQLKLWFASLIPTDRVKTLMLRSSFFTWVIKLMQSRLLLFENCIFSFTVQNSQILYNETEAKRNWNEKYKMENKLLSAVRLSDDLELLDTFSISREFVKDVKEFFKILDVVSGDKFGTKPCRLQKTGCYYTWEFPDWFKYTEQNTIDNWIAANIEST